MSIVSLELFKKHVRADEFTDDDELLQFYLGAAETLVIRYTHRTEGELIEIGGGDEFPAPVKQAIMMLAGHWYNQRESVAGVQMHEVPDTLAAILKPYRKLAEDAGGTDETSD